MILIMFTVALFRILARFQSLAYDFPCITLLIARSQIERLYDLPEITEWVKWQNQDSDLNC